MTRARALAEDVGKVRAGDVGLGVAAKVVPAVADAQQSDEAAAGTRQLLRTGGA